VSIASIILSSGLFGIVWWTGRSFVGAVFEGPVARDLGVLAVLLAGVLVASGVGVFQDLVTAGLVGHRLGFFAALDLAWRTLRGRIIGLWGHRAIRSTGAAAALGAASLAAIQVGMRSPSDAAWAQLLLEASLVASTCLRASWLGVACEALSERAALSATFRSGLRDEESSSKNPPAAAPR